MIRFRVIGKKATKAFQNEGGIHLWQRIPPTEKRGRTQTSSITVAVLPEIPTSQINIDKRDLEWKTCRGSGSGGQHRNVTDSAVQLTHKPTNIKIRCESGRSQHANKETALQVLAAKLESVEKEKKYDSYNDSRRNQIRTGHRGDNKVRIIKLQEDLAINNQTGKRMSAKKYMRGHLEPIL
jgi:peptide chain release factor 1